MEEEYLLMLALFRKLIKKVKQRQQAWDELEEMMSQRSVIMLKRAFKGIGVSYDEALRILRTEGLEGDDEVMRRLLDRAVDNLVDFSVASQYKMAREIEDMIDNLDIDEMDIDGLEDIMEPINIRFNKLRMTVENEDAQYAMGVAGLIAFLRENTPLTYMTQQDNRVRPWHLQYQGFTAPKSAFPDWLIPPIEHGCRCYLIEDENGVLSQIQASAPKPPEMPTWFNPTFKESIAKGGRIFSDEHPYFKNILDEDKPRLKKIAKRIKDGFYGTRNSD